MDRGEAKDPAKFMNKSFFYDTVSIFLYIKSKDN